MLLRYTRRMIRFWNCDGLFQMKSSCQQLLGLAFLCWVFVCYAFLGVLSSLISIVPSSRCHGLVCGLRLWHVLAIPIWYIVNRGGGGGSRPEKHGPEFLAPSGRLFENWGGGGSRPKKRGPEFSAPLAGFFLYQKPCQRG